MQSTSFVAKVGQWIIGYKFTLLTLLYFLIVSIRIIDMGYNKPVMISALALGLWLHLISKTNSYLRIVLCFVFAFIVTVNAYFAFALNSSLTMGVLGSIFETNTAEASNMSKKILPIGIPLLILAFGLMCLSTAELKKSRVPAKYSAIALVVYIFIIIPTFSYNYLRLRPTKRWNDLPEHPFVTIDELGLRVAPIFYGNMVTVGHMINEQSKFKRFYNTDEKLLPEGLSYHPEVHVPNTIYFILGESSTRAHYSLYGYKYPTTPSLDSINKVDSSFRLYNGLSSAALTRDVLRTTLTYAVPHDMDRFYTYKTVIELANDAGYETIWIAQESQMGKGVDAYMNAIYRGSKTSAFNHSYSDIALLPLVRKAVDPSKKQFILIHMAGSHLDYDAHYDKVDEAALQGNYGAIYYDRTLHQTDRTLRGIYDIAHQNAGALLMFYSDHGEEINVGHGYKRGRMQFKVPLLYSNNCGINIDSIMPKYHYQADGQAVVGTVSTYFMIAEIMGYEVTDAAAKQSVEESKYIYHPDGQVEPYENIRE